MEVLTNLARSTPAGSWRAPSRLAGWSVADLFAHVCDIEEILAGDPRAYAEPDWSSLPHVTNDISRFTEVGVDARRSRTQDEVIDEMTDLHHRRLAQLSVLPDDAEVSGPMGKLQPLTRVLRMRCFDLAVHTRDVRVALGQEPTLDSPAYEVAYATGVEAATRKWQKHEPSLGHLIITVTDGDDLDLGGSGDDLHLVCTRDELFDMMSGRTVNVDTPWQLLNISP